MQNKSLRTEFDPKSLNSKIMHSDTVLTIGSCFSQSMGAKLKKYKFDVLANPFGTVYNPISIFKLLESKEVAPDKYVEHNGMTFHYDFHSEIRSVDKPSLESHLSDLKSKVHGYVQEVSWLIITFGTAWVYELKATNKVVANCHKVPQKEFDKRLLGMKEMSKAFDNFYHRVKKVNPNIKILLTLSPVRHTKDGIEENQLSKSMLRVLSDFCVTSHENVHYFPSYELMMDDLRDYRFYKDDMIHPTEFAEQYIWEKFRSTCFDIKTNIFIDEWTSILSAMAHKPFNPKSEEHQKFIKAQIKRIKGFEAIVSVEKELAHFEDKLEAL